MPRKTAADFDPEVLKLFDGYVHGQLSRRDFLSKAVKFTGGGLTALGILEALSPNFAEGEQIPANDARVQTSMLEFASPKGSGTVRGYLAKPAQVKGKVGSILVVHENRGLNPHIQDIARRLAVDGFLAFAPDALTSLGGYPGDEDKARELFPKLDQTKIKEDFLEAFAVLKKQPESNGKVGAVGFCYGGGMVNFLATHLPDLAAGVPFYGSQPPAEEVPKIKAPLLIQYAEKDDRINGGWPKYEEALKANSIKYQAFIYPGVQHGFNNDTTPRYDAAAAKLAWDRTLAFFKEHLKG